MTTTTRASCFYADKVWDRIEADWREATNQVDAYNASYAMFIDRLVQESMATTDEKLCRKVEFWNDMASFEATDEKLCREVEFWNSMVTFETITDSLALEKDMRLDPSVAWVDQLVM